MFIITCFKIASTFLFFMRNEPKDVWVWWIYYLYNSLWVYSVNKRFVFDPLIWYICFFSWASFKGFSIAKANMFWHVSENFNQIKQKMTCGLWISAHLDLSLDRAVILICFLSKGVALNSPVHFNLANPVCLDSAFFTNPLHMKAMTWETDRKHQVIIILFLC